MCKVSFAVILDSLSAPALYAGIGTSFSRVKLSWIKRKTGYSTTFGYFRLSRYNLGRREPVTIGRREVQHAPRRCVPSLLWPLAVCGRCDWPPQSSAFLLAIPLQVLRNRR